MLPLKLSDLNKIRSTQGDVTNARKVLHNTNRVSLAFYKCNLADLLIKKIEELFGGKVTLRGVFMYPSNGYCGWHTNSNVIGKRIYLVWAKTSNQSFFRYWDDRESRIVTKYDKKGWNIRTFDIKPNTLFWHCVYSDTLRISIGFKYDT